MKKIVLFFCFLISLSTSRVSAQAGILDNGFGNGGKVATSVGAGSSEIWGMAIQADWSIVVGGFAHNGTDSDFAIVRYLPSGALDSSFGNNGIVTTDIGNGHDVVYSVDLQQDGKIVAAGVSSNGSDNDFTVARYNTDGSLDNTFGNNGIVTTAVGPGNDRGTSVKIQSDWSIVVGGISNNGSNNDFALVRYLTDGTLDSTLGNNGKVTTPMYSGNDMAFSLAIQSDWSIVLGGTAHNGTDYDFAIARFKSNGSLDSTFGTYGKVFTPMSSDKDFIWSVIVQTDGKIVAGGYSTPDSTKDFALARYNSDGSLDTTFAHTGMINTGMGEGDEDAYSLVLQTDGKILAGGTADSNGIENYAIARYNSDGSLDNSFGSYGYIITVMSEEENEIYSMALQQDGKIVAAGFGTDNAKASFTVARYITDLTLGLIDFSVSSEQILIYPNPVAQNAVLEYTLSKEETISIRLLDTQGKTMKTFVDSQLQNSGSHKQPIAFGSELPSGTYFIVISTPHGKMSIKLVK